MCRMLLCMLDSNTFKHIHASMLYTITSNLLLHLWNPFICTKVTHLLASKHQHRIKHIPQLIITHYTSLLSLWLELALCSTASTRAGRAAVVPLSLFAVIIFTRQLWDRPRSFDVSLVVLGAAAWSALIPTTVQRLKLLKQELDEAIVCSINGRTIFYIRHAHTRVLTHAWPIHKEEETY